MTNKLIKLKSIKLTGSEKQIKWATSILDKFIDGVERSVKNIEVNLEDEVELREEVLNLFDKLLEVYMDVRLKDRSVEDSSYWISSMRSYSKDNLGIFLDSDSTIRHNELELLKLLNEKNDEYIDYRDEMKLLKASVFWTKRRVENIIKSMREQEFIYKNWRN